MASSILPLVNGEATSSLLSGGIVPTGTTSAIAGTGTALYVIDGTKEEIEFDPTSVAKLSSTSTAGTATVIGSNLYMNRAYQSAQYQIQQANNVRDIDEMLAAQSPEYIDELLAMVDTREQELVSLEEQEEKVHVKHL